MIPAGKSKSMLKLELESLKQRLKILEKSIFRSESIDGIAEPLILSSSIMTIFIDKNRLVKNINGSKLTFNKKGKDELINRPLGEALNCLNYLADSKECGYGEKCKDCKIFLTVKNTLKTKKSHLNIEASLPQMIDGVETQLVLYVSTYFINNGESKVLVNIEDITDYRKLEDTLRIQTEMLSNMMEAVFMLGFDDGFVKYCNPATEKIFARSELELYNTRIFDLFDPGEKSSDEFSNEMLSKVKKIGAWDSEVQGKKKDGDNFWGHLSLSIFVHHKFGEVVIAVLSDITERKIAEKQLHYHSELMKNIDTSFISTDLDDNIVSWSSYAETLFLWSKDEVLGRKSIDVLFPDDYKNEHISAREKLEDIGLFEYNTFLIKKNGEKFSSHIIFTFLNDSKGSRSGILLMCYDISTTTKAIEDLQKSDEKFAEFSDLLPQAVFEIDGTGKLLFANQKVFDFFGYTQEDFINGIDVFKSIISADRKRAIDDMQGALTGKKVENLEYTATRKDGSTFPIMVYSILLKEENNNISIKGVLIDMTSVEAAQQKIAESENRFSNLINQSPIVIEVYSMEGILLSANKAYEELWGVEVSKTINKFNILSSQDVRENGLIDYLNIAYQGKAVSVPEYMYDSGRDDVPGKRGGIRWLATKIFPVKNSSGEIYNVVVTHEDVTERKGFEQKIIESEARFNLAMNASEDGIFDWNLKSDEIYYSPALKSMLGYEDHELPNDLSLFENLLNPNDREAFWKMHKELINKERKRFELEFQMKHKNGIWVSILAKAGAHFDELDVATRIIGTHRDITKRKKIQAELRRREEMLAQTGEVAKIGGWELVVHNLQTYFTEETFHIHDLPIGQTPSLEESINFYAPEARPIIAQAVKNAMEKGIPYDLQLPFITSKGRHIWINTICQIEFKDNAPYRLYGAIQDITEKKTSEQKLDDFSKIFEDSVNEIFIFDADTLKFIKVNQAALNNLGFSMKELQNMTTVDIKPEMSREEFLALSEPLKKGMMKKVVFETIHERKDKSIYYIESHLQFRKSEERSVFTAILLDISDRKKTEAELKKHQEKLEELVVKRTKGLDKKNQELDQMLKVFVGRELKIKELQNEINSMKGRN